MNIIVVGCGRVGSQLATMLSIEGHNVVVIDREEMAFEAASAAPFNGVTIRGLGFDEEVLEEAGIREADAFCATTDLDNTNLMACEVARKIFGVRHVVARLYIPVRERTYQQLDPRLRLWHALVAESRCGEGSKARSRASHLNSIEDIEVIEFRAGEALEGQRVSDVELARRFRIFSVVRGRAAHVPDSDTVLHEGDIIFAAVKDEVLPKVERFMKE